MRKSVPSGEVKRAAQLQEPEGGAARGHLAFALRQASLPICNALRRTTSGRAALHRTASVTTNDVSMTPQEERGSPGGVVSATLAAQTAEAAAAKELADDELRRQAAAESSESEGEGEFVAAALHARSRKVLRLQHTLEQMSPADLAAHLLSIALGGDDVALQRLARALPKARFPPPAVPLVACTRCSLRYDARYPAGCKLKHMVNGAQAQTAVGASDMFTFWCIRKGCDASWTGDADSRCAGGLCFVGEHTTKRNRR